MEMGLCALACGHIFRCSGAKLRVQCDWKCEVPIQETKVRTCNLQQMFLTLPLLPLLYLCSNKASGLLTEQM